jgi:hypothetical protein
VKNETSLKQKIEISRQRLYELEQQHGFGHSSILKQSMVLDELINQYNHIYYVQAKGRSINSNRLDNDALLKEHSNLYCHNYSASLI